MPDIIGSHLVFGSLLLYSQQVVHVIHVVLQLVQLVSSSTVGQALLDCISFGAPLNLFKFVCTLSYCERFINNILEDKLTDLLGGDLNFNKRNGNRARYGLGFDF